ncbi:hypothetical protein SLS59_001653 [Nothophoma quercina]|uniref:Uncharacterized protein n=1 Tax=Nothophoma quercina TaxID=749835 RepID=A0ABR3RYD0_9PLEO
MAIWKGKSAQSLRDMFEDADALVDLIGEDAADSKQALGDLKRETDADACFELLKHWFTEGI